MVPSRWAAHPLSDGHLEVFGANQGLLKPWPWENMRTSQNVKRAICKKLYSISFTHLSFWLAWWTRNLVHHLRSEWLWSSLNIFPSKRNPCGTCVQTIKTFLWRRHSGCRCLHSFLHLHIASSVRRSFSTARTILLEKRHLVRRLFIRSCSHHARYRVVVAALFCVSDKNTTVTRRRVIAQQDMFDYWKSAKKVFSKQAPMVFISNLRPRLLSLTMLYWRCPFHCYPRYHTVPQTPEPPFTIYAAANYAAARSPWCRLMSESVIMRHITMQFLPCTALWFDDLTTEMP